MNIDKNKSIESREIATKFFLEQKIRERSATIGVIGLGAIGLSLVDAFAKVNYKLRGYDKDHKRIAALNRGNNIDDNFPLPHFFHSLKSGNTEISDCETILSDVDIMIISVPTSLDKNNNPDLTCLRAAFHTVKRNFREKQLIIVQSTTYPGCTEEELLPLLEGEGISVGKDFYLSHVPEIVDIGNVDYTFEKIPRIVSGVTTHCLRTVSLFYQSIGCEIVPCSSPSVAEAAKILQNSYRLINISLVNEIKILLDTMGIDVWEVIEAASSKPYGFAPFYPGPGVGGDCIPVDPIYLRWKGREKGAPTSLIDTAVKVNSDMPHYVVGKVIEALNDEYRSIRGSSILVLGVAYKKDVAIAHFSPCEEIISKIVAMGGDVYYHDPHIPAYNVNGELLQSIDFSYDELSTFDCVVIVVDHSWYDYKKIAKKCRTIVDSRNILGKISHSGKVIKA